MDESEHINPIPVTSMAEMSGFAVEEERIFDRNRKRWVSTEAVYYLSKDEEEAYAGENFRKYDVLYLIPRRGRGWKYSYWKTERSSLPL